jgi:hypothetical protein
MNAQTSRPFVRQPSAQTPLSRVAAWVGRRLRARRARRLEEETVVCLSGMDTKLLNDIGVELGKLDELSGERPPVKSAGAARPTRHAIRRRR